MIKDNIINVPDVQAMSRLKPMLNGLRSHWDRVYIGLTTDPDMRWQKHEPNGWSEMRVVYDAFTAQIGINLERALIAYANQCNFIIPVENISQGGEGIRNSGARESHFLYVLLGDKRGAA